MKFNIHAGHNADGEIGCGAVGLIKESTEARLVKNEVINQLKALGHTVYDCTCDKSVSVFANLSDIVYKCNKHTVDLDVSIHFNSGANDQTGNGKSCGTEVLIYSDNSKSRKYATDVCKYISSLGFANRGVKIRPELYVLRHTNAPSILIECCFVDDADDIKIYNVKKMASAIVKGLTGQSIATNESDTTVVTKKLYSGKFPKLPKRGWFTLNDKGTQVKRLQMFLNWFGNYGLVVDGKLGMLTYKAITDFQKKNHITIDGYFGSDCLEKAKICTK